MCSSGSGLLDLRINDYQTLHADEGGLVERGTVPML